MAAASPISAAANNLTQHKLDLSNSPPVFVSATHFETKDLHKVEDELVDAGAPLTYDLKEARIVLSKAIKKPRIVFDLKTKGLWTEEVTAPDSATAVKYLTDPTLRPAKKARLIQSQDSGKDAAQAIVVGDSSTESEAEDGADAESHTATAKQAVANAKSATSSTDNTASVAQCSEDGIIRVVRFEWYQRSRAQGRQLPLEDFVTYRGRQIEKPPTLTEPATRAQVKLKPQVTASTYTSQARQKLPAPDPSIVERAKEDAPSQTTTADRFGKRKFGHKIASSAGASWEAGHGKNSQHAHLLHTTTSEYDQGVSSDLPEPPEWVKAGIVYACGRITPRQNPNDAFISLLKQIKLARLLTNDEIGVRAYSTSIASLAAYPFKISNPREILALPGCDVKVANLYVEWANTGKIKAVEDINADENLKVLRHFYDIWGVGATTARELYFDKGWKDLDDIVEYGWKTLSRVQQIGVKYYEGFQDLIPREEVEAIGRIIHRHARKVRDDNIQSLLVGGYRRGKEACGDVDIIVSHPDEKQTLNIVNDIVASLEEEGWITHTLLLSLISTNRHQQTLPFSAGKAAGSGFDTLDKALVVWQDPHWPTKDADLAANPKAKNPSIHRRVDIIVSPWRTVGCAVTGWSGGTTFQRDLRRYVKAVKGWKFDSSGVRDRGNGEVVDLEGYYEYDGKFGKGRAKTMDEAEKRVFEGIGLEYREPWERCTG